MNNKLDLKELERQIETMSVRSQLYAVLRDSLTKRGWWKNRPRGKAEKGKMNGKKENTAN